MFYLKNMISTCLAKPIMGMGFIVTSFLLITSTFLLPTSQDYLKKVAKKGNDGPFFHALISSKENFSRIKRKVTSLPGVETVTILSQNDLQAKVKGILGNLDMENDLAGIDLNFVGLKVLFKNKLKLKSQTLIRDYIKRLVGDRNITLGATVATEEEGKIGPLQIFEKLGSWSLWAFIGLLFLLWLSFTWFFCSKLNEFSYLIETYQRKTKVAVKSYLGFILTMALPTIALIFFLPQSSWIPMIALAIMMIIGLLILKKSHRWSSEC